MQNKDITNMIEKYELFVSEISNYGNNVEELLKRNIKQHKCDEIKEYNKKLNEYPVREIYKDDDIEWVSIIKDIKTDACKMTIIRWNDKDECFEGFSAPILICPYCGKILYK